MIVFCSIHGEINISEYAKRIIDTPEYQRLRVIFVRSCHVLRSKEIIEA